MEEKDQQTNELVNYKAVLRTALDTLGLLKIFQFYKKTLSFYKKIIII